MAGGVRKGQGGGEEGKIIDINVINEGMK